MKHIILAVALIAFSAPALATGDPPPPPPRHTIGGTVAFSGSGAFLGGHGNSKAQVETGNVAFGHAQVGPNAQRSLTSSESWGKGASSGRGSFAGAGYGLGGAFTIGRF